MTSMPRVAPPAPLPLYSNPRLAGYQCVPLTGVARSGAAPSGVQATAARWLAPDSAPAAAPLAVDVHLERFGSRAQALRALTAEPVPPHGMTLRSLFPPRVGDETIAWRADSDGGDAHHVIYRVDILIGSTLATVAAVWRWPAGSPAWVYEHARGIARSLRSLGPAAEPRAGSRAIRPHH